MKKGFTLIELIAVFTLLGILLLFVIPQITSMLKKENTNSYEDFKKNIYIATEAYVVEEKISIENSTSTIVYLKDVIEKGYLKSTLVNPETKEEIKNMTSAKIIVMKNNDGILSFELLES